MATCWIISKGYDYQKNTTIEKIIGVAKGITKKNILSKAVEYSKDKKLDKCEVTIEEFIQDYWNVPTEDALCRLSDNGIILNASGSGCRDIKDVVIKAFLSLLIDDCHKKGLSVQLFVG